MKPSLQKLQKFFRLEAERGYDNRAVVGGFERMLSPWVSEARVEGIPEDLISSVSDVLTEYHSLSPDSRHATLQELWKKIQTYNDNKDLIGLTGKENDEESQSDIPPQFSESSETIEDHIVVDEQPEVEIEIEIEPDEEVKRESTPVNQSELTKPSPEALQKPEPAAALNAPVTVLVGVGIRHGQTLNRLGVYTLGDLLYYFPRRYDDYSTLKTINRLWYGEQVTIIATIQYASTRHIRNGRMSLTEAVVSDGTGSMRVTWFNQPWIAKRLRQGMQVVLSGKIDQYLGRLTMSNPEFDQIDQQSLSTNRIVPIYRLTAHITQKWLRGVMNQVVSYWSPRIQDFLPHRIRRYDHLMELSQALYQIHFPDTQEQLNAARHRLAFDELFLLQLGMLRQKNNWHTRTARMFEISQEWLEQQYSRLPYELTSAQQHAIKEIRSDLVSGHPMNRLLQGDVGSGKTVVAALAVGMVVQHGSQAAIMAPTSILAEQHYKSMLELLANQGLVLKPDQIRLLIGATPEVEKSAIREGLADGTTKLVIGTHALIEDPITFQDLQVAIIDEQHRFGVEQRAALRLKGENPHLLVMTATPIPRSLALTIYGDLDLLTMNEMPPGRQPVSTHVLLPRERERAYKMISNQVKQGYQAFIIYPLVEEGEKEDGETPTEGRAAVEEYARLQSEIFPELQLGLLHGRLRSEEKDEVMDLFHEGEIDILVSTSVVEVGVDIPNATVILIEGANRFGLAQLHQFRGRVGRGDAKAYCVLIPETEDAAENERLSAMVQTNDGFVLAEKDLQQRGPGDFLGTRQSGYVQQLRMANLSDIQLIEKAQQSALNLFKQDPMLEKPEHQKLAMVLADFWGEKDPGKGDLS